jgi:hypothetical protein
MRTLAAVMLAHIGFFAPATAKAAELDLKAVAPGEVKKVEDFLRNFAQGNEGSAAVTKAVINTDNGEVTVEAQIRSRHVIGREPFTNKPIVVIDWTVSGTISCNPRAGRVQGEVDFGRGIKVPVGSVASNLPSAK